MPIQDQVFISYSRADRAFVSRLAADLRANGIGTWIDVENIQPGSQWVDEIDRGISIATSLIIVLSKKMTRSRWVLHELDAAIASGRQVFPVVIDDVDFSNLPPQISRIQYVDFRDDYASGLDMLLRVFGVDSSQPSQPVTERPETTRGYVFISYTQEDSEFVAGLREFLKEKGYAYWDYDDSDRDYGAQFLLELEAAINEASAMVSIISPNWKMSKWAIREFLYSEQVSTPVFLLKVRELEPTLAIADMTPIDFTAGLERGFARLERQLSRRGL